MHQRAIEFSDIIEEEHGFRPEIEEFPKGTRTAEDAANAVGCELGQIVKSLVMKSGEDFYLVLCSGENRVDMDRMAEKLEVENVDTASPDEAKDVTGWSIGGVPPVGLDSDIPVFMDSGLLAFDEVWSAAGTHEAVFRADPAELKSLSGAEVGEFFE